MDILIDEMGGSLWVASVERGRLLGLDIDPDTERVRYGSVYWAKVNRIDAGMDAAFLDLDDENTGLLYNRDVRIKKDGKVIKGGDVAIGKLLSPGQLVLVQARAGYLPRESDDDLPPLEKTPVVTMDLAFAGRYLISTPFDETCRISSRIRDKTLRAQLEKMAQSFTDMHGVILRKSAAHTQTDLIIREEKILRAVWENVERAMEGAEPHIIMLGPDAMQRTLGDQAASRIDRIDVVAFEHFNDVQQWCEIFAPDLVTKIRAVQIADDNVHDLGLILEQSNLMEQIDNLLDPYTILPGGGNIITQSPAAMTVIDVNAGPDRRGGLIVNLEAAHEIARQIRLRNLGGIIVVDFLKMTELGQKRQIIDVLQAHFDDDPCTVQIHGFTKLGLLEITRARRTPTLAERIEALGIDEYDEM